jgi:hypothetical protein
MEGMVGVDGRILHPRSPISPSMTADCSLLIILGNLAQAGVSNDRLRYRFLTQPQMVLILLGLVAFRLLRVCQLYKL